MTELYRSAMGGHPEALVFAYALPIRPGVVKGWNLIASTKIAPAVIAGVMELVLFDPRPESSTCGESAIVMTGHQRSIVNVPRNLWHADHNIGTTDAVVVNFPTIPYNHANPAYTACRLARR